MSLSLQISISCKSLFPFPEYTKQLEIGWVEQEMLIINLSTVILFIL